MQSLLGREAESPGLGALDLQAVETAHINRVLKMSGGNKSQAARILGIDRRTLQRKGF